MSFLGNIGGLFGFGGGGDDYLSKIPDVLHQYYDPYVKGGLKDYDQLQNVFKGLMENPQDTLAHIGAGYTNDPGYQFGMNQGLQAANHAAAAGGMSGSPQAMARASQFATNYANQHYQDYLRNALGLYNTGVQGETHFADTGYDASKNLADNLARYYMTRANRSDMQGENALGGVSNILSEVGNIL